MAARSLTPARRDALTCVFALVLLTAPLWSLPLDFGEQVHEYERAEVTVNGSTIEYAPELEDTPYQVPISDEIGCSAYDDLRVCAFESYLATNHTVPTDWQASPESGEFAGPADERYRYARVEGRIYEPIYTTTPSPEPENASDGSLVRIYLDLEPVDPRETLAAVSVDAADVPPTVRRAAWTGSANHTGSVEVPETPVRTSTGYYRVFEAGVNEPSVLTGFFGLLLRFFAPVVGLGLLVGLRERFQLRHVSKMDERGGEN
ncbi:hypothetical protein [Halorientalis pallida]|uniref:Uncharacterized protein n=1 Tax=Halorientalis pallida TaxID=2479928 RepID=A0A498KZ79_9EURY|nr:hypothetical protein [Halorientalis pallida]RXK51107.1 hypothetical protein EAF64_00195 [Halorientalis pallida]